MEDIAESRAEKLRVAGSQENWVKSADYQEVGIGVENQEQDNEREAAYLRAKLIIYDVLMRY